jgi:hypothetical protein
MLAAVDVAKCLAGMFTVALFKLLVPVEVLVPLKPIEQDASEGFVEVLLYAGNDFLENVCICRARTTVY